MNTQLTGKVLVVEDNIVNQKLTCSILRKVGLDFEVAYHGEEAISLWNNNSFDLILMDCQMPIMDGYVATQKIRKMETDSHIPIIALTANAMENDDKRCINSGMDDFLSKPFTIQDFVSKLEKWLHRTPESNNNSYSSAALDYEIINDLKELLEDDFNDIIDIYINSTTDILKEMHLANSTNNYSTIQRLAHSLKSSSENVGAIQISTLSKEIEQQILRNDFTNIQSKTDELNRLFMLFIPALKNITV